MIIDKQLLENVVEVRRKGDRILLIKLILGREIFNVISIYAPQVGLDESSKRLFWEDLDVSNVISVYAPQVRLDESSKRQFWEDLDEIVQSIPIREKLFIGDDPNGHVGTSHYGFDSVHIGFDFGGKKWIM